MGKLVMSIDSYGTKHTVEMSDESTMDQCVKAFVDLMIATGYSEEGLAEIFKDGDPRRWDSAWSDNEQG